MEAKAREVYPSGPTVEVTIGFTEDEIVELFRRVTDKCIPPRTRYKHYGVYETLIRDAVRNLRPGNYVDGTPR